MSPERQNAAGVRMRLFVLHTPNMYHGKPSGLETFIQQGH